MNQPKSDASPPVDFPIYGLDGTWNGTRWLEFFEGRIGDPAWGVWLGHRLGTGAVLVGTLPRERYDRIAVGLDADRLAEIASSGTFKLINLTLPDASVPRSAGMIPSLLNHAEQNAKEFAGWPRIDWLVDGRRVSASVWRFGGAWTAFTDDLPDSYVIAVGVNIEPGSLILAQVKNGQSYGVDLAANLDVDDLNKRVSARPDAVWLNPNRNGFHPDQLLVNPGNVDL